MKFKQAVQKSPQLENAWREGLQALHAEDKPHIEAANPRQLRGSVDVDAALKQLEPHANRWDFAIAYQHRDEKTEHIYWVELHTASDSQVKVLRRKAVWLLSWLQDGGRLLKDFKRDIVWVSSGPTTFTRDAPKQKLLAEVGVRHVGSRLRIGE